MATKKSTDNLQNFVINKVPDFATFRNMELNNQVNANELYFIEEQEVNVASIGAGSTNGTILVTPNTGSAYSVNTYTHPAYTPRDSGLYKITVDNTGHITAVTAVEKSDITNLGIPGQDTNTTYSAKSDGGLGLTSGHAFYIQATGVTNDMLAGSIANNKLVNSTISIAGNNVSLGGSLTADTLRTSLGLSAAIHFLGIATVTITDGSTTDPRVNNAPTTVVAGDVVIDKDSQYEYIWNGAAWERLGGDSSYVVKGSTITYQPAGTINNHSYQPAGTVSKPSFTGTKATISMSGNTTGVAVTAHTYTPAGTISSADATGTNINYTPKGTVSAPSFTGTAGTVRVSGTAQGSVSTTVIEDANGNYTPEGTVTKPNFSGTAATIRVSGTAQGSVSTTITESSTGNYTPAGSVSVTPNVTLNTTTVNSITAVGTLPTFTQGTFSQGTLPTLSMSIDDETLSYSWSQGTLPTHSADSFSQGTLPTKGSNTTVATGIKTQTASASFTGTKVDIATSFVGAATTATGSYTPAGSVTQPTFSGTRVNIASTFTGAATTATGSYTPAGSVGQPSFTGTGAKLTFSGTETTLSHSVTQGSVSMSAEYTPAGSVTQPTFTGTTATLSHTFTGTTATLTVN